MGGRGSALRLESHRLKCRLPPELQREISVLKFSPACRLPCTEAEVPQYFRVRDQGSPTYIKAFCPVFHMS